MMIVCINEKPQANGNYISRFVRTEYVAGSPPVDYSTQLGAAHHHVSAGGAVAVMYVGQEALDFLKEIGHGGTERKESKVWPG